MIARALAVVAVASAPLMLGVSGASATGGCTVNNTAPDLTVKVVVDSSKNPPVSTSIDTHEMLFCTYESGGGQLNWGCTLYGGRCHVYVNDSLQAACTGYAGTSCASFLNVQPGDQIALEVYGGSGFVADAV